LLQTQIPQSAGGKSDDIAYRTEKGYVETNCQDAHPGQIYEEKMKHKKLVRAIILFSFLFLLSSFASAQNQSNDTIQLWVTVAKKTMVDIQPDLLAWHDVFPGYETNASDLVGWSSKKPAIQIDNIGSTNISKIWFNTSYPPDSPFGTGLASEYDTGNFAVIKRNATGGDNDTYFFVNRVEYNESELIYLILPSPKSEWAHGRFRSANKEWFWAINVTGDNCSDQIFKITKDPHNQSQLGDYDLTGCNVALSGPAARAGGTCREDALTPTAQPPYTGNDMWGYKNLHIGTDTNYDNYTVAVHWNCSKQVTAMFYKWNKDAPGAQEDGNYSKYFSEETLKPGQHIIGHVKLRIPYGTAAGNITGALTVTVQEE